MNERVAFLHILGKDWQAIFTDDDYVYDGKDGADGMAQHWLQKLQITARHPQEQGRILCHEILHVYDEELNMELTEHQVELLGTALYQLLSDNDIYAILNGLTELQGNSE